MVKEGLQDTDSSCTGSGTGWELQGAHSTVTASRAAATATSWVKSNLANIFSWPLKAMGQTTRFTLENKWSLFELWFPGVELVLLISTIIFCIWTNTHTHTQSPFVFCCCCCCSVAQGEPKGLLLKYHWLAHGREGCRTWQDKGKWFQIRRGEI